LSPLPVTDRFRDYAARKTREAREARLFPFTTAPGGRHDGLDTVESAWSNRLFDGPFFESSAPAPDLPSSNVVFVQSRAGNTVAADPSVLGGGETDKHLVYEGLSRVTADAVLAGAETVRNSDLFFSVWRDEFVALRASLGQPRHPAQIIATLGGMDLEGELVFNVPELTVFVLTVGAGLARMHEALAVRPWIRPIVMPHQSDLPAAFRGLRSEGIARISIVGGRTIATALIDAGLVQDLYITTSPRDGGAPNTPMHPRPLETSPVTRKRGTGEDSGVVFDHLILTSKIFGQSLPVTNSRS